MNCNRLYAQCKCGNYGQPMTLWITDTKSLLVTCFCIKCENVFNVIFTLAELFKACPRPEPPTAELERKISDRINEIIANAKNGEFTEDDKKALHEWGIDPGESP